MNLEVIAIIGAVVLGVIVITLFVAYMFGSEQISERAQDFAEEYLPFILFVAFLVFLGIAEGGS